MQVDKKRFYQLLRLATRKTATWRVKSDFTLSPRLSTAIIDKTVELDGGPFRMR
jgi:hypothetical protein